MNKEDEWWEKRISNLMETYMEDSPQAIANLFQQEINKAVLEERGYWRLAIMHLPTEQRESVIKTFDELLNKINI